MEFMRYKNCYCMLRYQTTNILLLWIQKNLANSQKSQPCNFVDLQFTYVTQKTHWYHVHVSHKRWSLWLKKYWYVVTMKNPSLHHSITFNLSFPLQSLQKTKYSQEHVDKLVHFCLSCKHLPNMMCHYVTYSTYVINFYHSYHTATKWQGIYLTIEFHSFTRRWSNYIMKQNTELSHQ